MTGGGGVFNSAFPIAKIVLAVFFALGMLRPNGPISSTAPAPTS
jgi:hypothetical protein